MTRRLHRLIPVFVLLAASAAAAQEEPLAGYSHGAFFLRSEGDDFVLVPHGRLQVDMFNYFRGDSPNAKLPESTFALRRVRPELNGTILRKVDFQIAGDWTVGGPNNNNQGLTDAYVAIEILPSLRLQIGQHDAPFSLENRSSDKYFDFMERSATVRAFGVPRNKETGAWLWGLLPKGVAYYSAGVFNGTGQNFRSEDGRLDIIGRGWLAPFALAGKSFFGELTFGGSFWYGSRGQGAQGLPSMTTQGGYAFLNPSYKLGDAAGTAVHLAPRRNQVKWALEADLPFTPKLGLRFELVHNDLGMDEVDGNNLLVHRGGLVGTSYYVQAWYYLLGDASVLPRPGLQIPYRLQPYEPTPAAKHALALQLRYEHLAFSYDNYGALPAAKDPAVGSFGLDVLEFGVNYWASKHLRFTLNYLLNHFSGDAGLIANTRPVGGSDYLHEILLRVAIAL